MQWPNFPFAPGYSVYCVIVSDLRVERRGSDSWFGKSAPSSLPTVQEYIARDYTPSRIRTTHLPSRISPVAFALRIRTTHSSWELALIFLCDSFFSLLSFMHSTPTSPAARISYCLTLPVITSVTVIYARVLRGPRSADLPERERRKDCTAGVGREAVQVIV